MDKKTEARDVSLITFLQDVSLTVSLRFVLDDVFVLMGT